MAQITHKVRAAEYEGDRDLEEWFCSEHGFITTTEVGADLSCCPECEAMCERDEEPEAPKETEQQVECQCCGALVFRKHTYFIQSEGEFLLICGNCYGLWAEEGGSEVEDTPSLQDEGYHNGGDY